MYLHHEVHRDGIILCMSACFCRKYLNVRETKAVIPDNILSVICSLQAQIKIFNIFCSGPEHRFNVAISKDSWWLKPLSHFPNWLSADSQGGQNWASRVTNGKPWIDVLSNLAVLLVGQYFFWSNQVIIFLLAVANFQVSVMGTESGDCLPII